MAQPKSKITKSVKAKSTKAKGSVNPKPAHKPLPSARPSVIASLQKTKVGRIPALHKRRYAIPLLVAAILLIAGLLLIPFMPQVQSVAQSYTKKHPAIAKLVIPAFQPPDLGVPDTGNWLVIPAASLKMPINEGDSIAVLNKAIGVWHQTGALNDNYVLAGHRLQYFRSVNQSLYHLDILKPGDRGIFLVTNGHQQEYRVNTSTVVAPTDIDILNSSGRPLLTIYTCNDFNNQSRLVVTAEPVKTF